MIKQGKPLVPVKKGCRMQEFFESLLWGKRTVFSDNIITLPWAKREEQTEISGWMPEALEFRTTQ